MAQFHFVEDYERRVAELIATHPIDEAMSLAVGGSYETIGDVASDVVVSAGLKPGMSVFDFGCGSGRVASALSRKVEIARFLGTDIVQSLLDYAATKTPRHFEFKLNRDLTVPAPDAVFDMAYAFSVFTHLLHTECYIYLQDIARTLKPGGRFVFSFLEFGLPLHWVQFERSANAVRNRENRPLTTFIERGPLTVWAGKAGFDVVQFIDGNAPVSNGKALGQSIAIFQKKP